MRHAIFFLAFALFAVAASAQSAAPKDPTVLVSYTIKRNWGGYQSGHLILQTGCLKVSSDQNPIPVTCLMDQVVQELTRQGKLQGANLKKPHRDYIEITGWVVLTRDIVLSTRDPRWSAPVKD